MALSAILLLLLLLLLILDLRTRSLTRIVLELLDLDARRNALWRIGARRTVSDAAAVVLCRVVRRDRRALLLRVLLLLLIKLLLLQLLLVLKLRELRGVRLRLGLERRMLLRLWRGKMMVARRKRRSGRSARRRVELVVVVVEIVVVVFVATRRRRRGRKLSSRGARGGRLQNRARPSDGRRSRKRQFVRIESARLDEIVVVETVAATQSFDLLHPELFDLSRQLMLARRNVLQQLVEIVFVLHFQKRLARLLEVIDGAETEDARARSGRSGRGATELSVGETDNGGFRNTRGIGARGGSGGGRRTKRRCHNLTRSRAVSISVSVSVVLLGKRTLQSLQIRDGLLHQLLRIH